ncbi:MAG: chemotaxis protein CheA [Syntrophomonas sp.]|uniref:chemotaxis protein CheA n=1 Tax=Syntrophomonas sp. TaxID=2053627 RepID=UPI00260F755F|nr:chemotaxis protein CheA [Syntrophomonas sp.]MDD2510043.1 chemotaxis protein CheA [Syntrophomonas sp.]MDD4626080.1 chemotaxis protein CheA [Syntrophomonas sp.]
MKMDMSQYLDVFLEESKEHLESLNQKLLDLEKNSGDIAALNEIFRAAHTLKGMSSTMGFEDLADLTHHMENVLSDLKEGLLEVNSQVVDILFQCFDRIQLIIERIESNGSGEMDNSELVMILEGIKRGNFQMTTPTTGSVQNSKQEESLKKPPYSNTSSFEFNQYDMTLMREAASRNFNSIYIKLVVDSGCLMKSVRAFMVFKALEEDSEIIKSLPPAADLEEGKFEEKIELLVISASPSSELEKRLNAISEIKVMEIKEIDLASLSPDTLPEANGNLISGSQDLHKESKGMQKGHKVKQTVRVDIDRLDVLMNLVGELVMHKGRLEQIGAISKIAELNETIEQIDRISGDLQSVVMKVRMVPVEQVFNRFPRMVRDLAKELNREVDFLIEGKETELDRTVIDEIGDPLVHLLRNAIDHGVESPQDRLKRGKTQKATVMLRARHEGNNVYIEVEDDGAGINIKRVMEKAVEKGIISLKEAELMSPEEAIQILFNPGFTTTENITDVSGRGVGLDVVKTKIESLSGEIFVDSRPGQGTRFKIKLPLTLAIIQALMISVSQEIYAIPLGSVDETTMIKSEDIKAVQNQEVIVLRGNVLPLFRLASLLEIPGDVTKKDEMYVVIVRKGERQIGLVVDTLIGQQEIVIKSLGRILTGIPGIAGAIVSGDGFVRLIIDVATLF